MNERNFAIKCMSLEQLVDAACWKTTVNFKLTSGYTIAATLDQLTVHVVEFKGREQVAVTFREDRKTVNRSARMLLASDVEWITVENSSENPPAAADYPPIPQHASFQLSIPGFKGHEPAMQEENTTERLQRQANEKPEVTIKMTNDVAPELSRFIGRLASTRSEVDIQLGQIFNSAMASLSHISMSEVRYDFDAVHISQLISSASEEFQRNYRDVMASKQTTSDELIDLAINHAHILMHNAACFALRARTMKILEKMKDTEEHEDV